MTNHPNRSKRDDAEAFLKKVSRMDPCNSEFEAEEGCDYFNALVAEARDILRRRNPLSVTLGPRTAATQTQG